MLFIYSLIIFINVLYIPFNVRSVACFINIKILIFYLFLRKYHFEKLSQECYHFSAVQHNTLYGDTTSIEHHCTWTSWMSLTIPIIRSCSLINSLILVVRKELKWGFISSLYGFYIPVICFWERFWHLKVNFGQTLSIFVPVFSEHLFFCLCDSRDHMWSISSKESLRYGVLFLVSTFLHYFLDKSFLFLVSKLVNFHCFLVLAVFEILHVHFCPPVLSVKLDEFRMLSRFLPPNSNFLHYSHMLFATETKLYTKIRKNIA